MLNLHLRNKFLLPTLLITILGIGAIIIISTTNARQAIDNQVKSELNQVVTLSSFQIDAWVSELQNKVKGWGQIPRLNDISRIENNPEEVNQLLKSYKEITDYYETIAIANKDGDVIAAANPALIGNINVKNRAYFEETLESGQTISNVIKSRISGNPIFTVTHKLSNGTNEGVIAAVIDLTKFSNQYIDPINIGETGYAYIVGKDGTLIAHPNEELILKVNALEDFDFGKKLFEGTQGTFIYDWKGQEKQVAYRQLPTSGWIVAAGANIDELMAPVHSMTNINLATGLLTILIIGVIIYFVAKSITQPIQKIINNLRQGSEEVSTASKQVSSSSQNLAEGASQQAASMQQTSSSLNEISSMTKNNAENTQQVNQLMKEKVKPNFQLMTKELANTKNVLDHAVDASEETAEIIKTIDDIAFQTNLLALNAAVEASRAGEAGKGFAVVAEEVRNLAQRAAEAAQQTAELIENSNEQIKKSTQYSDNLSEAVDKNEEIVQQIVHLVGEVTEATEEQTDGISQINTTVSEIDSVTQSVASNAEQAAASSQELDAQAESMLAAIAQLKNIIDGGDES